MPVTDYKSSLPVRTEADGADERLHVKIVDPSNPSTQQATVDTDQNLHVEIHGNDPTAADKVVRLSELGSVSIDGVYDGTNNTDPSEIGLVGLVRNNTPADSQQTLRITAITSADSTVRALDVSLHDEAGEPFSNTNPLPVTFTENEGTEVHDYFVNPAVATNATVNHDYTVTALKTLLLSQVLCSASGRAKFEIMVETGVGTGIFNTICVRFNSTATADADMNLAVVKNVGAGVKVRVAVTNRDNQVQDIYTTIVGTEI